MWKRAAVIGCLVALVLLVVVDLALSSFLTALQNKPSANHPSYTIAESRQRGAFVERVTVTPSVIDWRGRRIVLNETWVERQTELSWEHVFVPFVWHHREFRTVSGHNLCFNVSEGWDVLWGVDRPFFVAEGHGASFGTRGTVIIWHRMEPPLGCPSRVRLTDNWKLKDSVILEVTRTP